MTPIAKKLLATAILLALCFGAVLLLKKPEAASVFSDGGKSKPETHSPADEPTQSLQMWEGEPTQFSNQPRTVRVLRENSFATGFCETRINPVWTIYTVRADNSRIDTVTEAKEILPNRKLPPNQQADGREFLATNLIPTPMAPRGIAGPDALKASNICVQEPNLRGTWKALEELELKYAKSYGEIQVITGPVFLPQEQDTFGKNLKAQIPDGFYKIMLRKEDGKLRALAFIFPQQSTAQTPDDLKKLLGRIAHIEKDTKLKFLPQMSELEQHKLKSIHETTLWE